MSLILPDCMMPDGADPCAGYAQLREDRDRLRAELDAAKRHAETVNEAHTRRLAQIDRYERENERLRAELDAANAKALRYSELYEQAMQTGEKQVAGWMWECNQAKAELDAARAALREIVAMTNEDTGTFRKRGGTYRGLVGIIAEKALGTYRGDW